MLSFVLRIQESDCIVAARALCELADRTNGPHVGAYTSGDVAVTQLLSQLSTMAWTLVPELGQSF